jgi:hypothetical protein
MFPEYTDVFVVVVFIAFVDDDDDDDDDDVNKVVPSVARSFIYEPLLQRFP